MKTKKKALLTVLCAASLVVGSVFGTYAYLTSDDKVENTFTVGNVKIILDELDVDNDNNTADNVTHKGENDAQIIRDRANAYHLQPGLTYTKDPMVTVLEGSDECYVKMTLTYNCAKYIDGNRDLDFSKVLVGYDSDTWQRQTPSVYDQATNTRTITFWYKDTVEATDGNVELDALFDEIAVPKSLTNDDLAALNGFNMTLNAYAIQAAGFQNATEAFAALDAQLNPPASPAAAPASIVE